MTAASSVSENAPAGTWRELLDDPAEGPTAAAAINTVQLMCGAFGAGLAGVVVHLTDTGGAEPARELFGVFAVLVAVGGVASYRSMRGMS